MDKNCCFKNTSRVSNKVKGESFSCEECKIQYCIECMKEYRLKVTEDEIQVLEETKKFDEHDHPMHLALVKVIRNIQNG